MPAPCAMKGNMGWQASPSSATVPTDHCGSGSRSYSALLSVLSQASSRARASGWKFCRSCASSFTLPSLVHEFFRVQLAWPVVAKMKVSLPWLSGKVTIWLCGLGPHHLVKASISGVFHALGGHHRTEGHHAGEARVFFAKQRGCAREWMPSAPARIEAGLVARLQVQVSRHRCCASGCGCACDGSGPSETARPAR